MLAQSFCCTFVCAWFVRSGRCLEIVGSQRDARWVMCFAPLALGVLAGLFVLFLFLLPFCHKPFRQKCAQIFRLVNVTRMQCIHKSTTCRSKEFEKKRSSLRSTNYTGTVELSITCFFFLGAASAAVGFAFAAASAAFFASRASNSAWAFILEKDYIF